MPTAVDAPMAVSSPEVQATVGVPSTSTGGEQGRGNSSEQPVPSIPAGGGTGAVRDISTLAAPGSGDGGDLAVDSTGDEAPGFGRSGHNSLLPVGYCDDTGLLLSKPTQRLMGKGAGKGKRQVAASRPQRKVEVATWLGQ